MANKNLSIRIDKELLDKLHYVADYKGRSANSEILILIKDAIENMKKSTEKFFIKMIKSTIGLFETMCY